MRATFAFLTVRSLRAGGRPRHRRRGLSRSGVPITFHGRNDNDAVAGAPLKASIPEDIAQFIRTYIDRLETLEVLLFLQSTRGKAGTARDVGN